MGKKKFGSKSSKRRIKLNEFRRFKNPQKHNDVDSHHPNYIYEREGENFNYLSMTHTPPTGGKYVRLTHNVCPDDNRPSYINTIAQSQNHNEFASRKKGWKIHEDDKKTVNKIIKKNKKNGN